MSARLHFLLLIACSMLAVPGPSAADDGNAQAEAHTGNLYLSGDEVRISKPVAADLFAAGRQVRIDQAVGADAAVAGGMVEITADIGQDLRTAGGTVEIGSRIGGDLLAAGKSVLLKNSTVVGGPAMIAGSDVVVNGRLADGARIYAGTITLNGRIDHGARLYGREITLSPGAVIDGDVIYASEHPLPPEQLAQISGKVIRENSPEEWEFPSRAANKFGFGFHAGFFLSMLVCGAFLYAFFPRAVAGARQSIKQYPLRSLAIGFALLFSLPPLALLFMITLVGLPIGLSLLALYPLFLLLGYLATAFFISREAADAMRQPKQVTTGKQIAFLAVALLILTVTAMIPVLGALAMFFALAIGLGGWAVWLHQRYRDSKTVQHSEFVLPRHD